MKKSEFKAYLREEIISVLSEEGTVTTDDASKAKELADKGVDVNLTEEDEDGPSDADLKKKDSTASTANKLQKLVAKMKDKAKEYKAAEGDAKEKIKDELKAMTAEKKKLEGSL